MNGEQQSFWRKLYYSLWWSQIKELERDLDTVERRKNELIRNINELDWQKPEEYEKARDAVMKVVGSDEEMDFDDKSILDGSFATILGILGEQSLKLKKTLMENTQLKEKIKALEKELKTIRKKQ